MTITLEQSQSPSLIGNPRGIPECTPFTLTTTPGPICKARARLSRTPPRTCSDKRAPNRATSAMAGTGKASRAPRRHKGVPRRTLRSGPNGRPSRRHTRGWVTSLRRNALHQGRAGPGVWGVMEQRFTTTRNTARNAKIPGQKARILRCVSGRWRFTVWPLSSPACPFQQS